MSSRRFAAAADAAVDSVAAAVDSVAAAVDSVAAALRFYSFLSLDSLLSREVTTKFVC